MPDGRPLIDAHVHAARLPTLRPAWRRWAEEFGSSHPWQDVYDEGGALVPERVDAYFERRLARRFVFGTDRPGVPGIARIARAVAALGLDEETLALVLAGNALRVYKNLTVPPPTREDHPMPDAGPFTDDVVRQIARHMNEDHAADCLTICRALGGRPGATAARMTGLDAEGIEFAVADGGVEHTVRIPFGERLTERPQVRREVVRMTERARAALGAPLDVSDGP